MNRPLGDEKFLGELEEIKERIVKRGKRRGQKD